MCIVLVKYKCENSLNSDLLNLAGVLHPAIPCSVLSSFKGGNECSGGEMFEFGYIAVNQGFTHKINIFEKNAPALHNIKDGIYVFHSPFMMSLLKHTDVSNVVQNGNLTETTIVCIWPYASELYVSSIS